MAGSSPAAKQTPRGRRKSRGSPATASPTTRIALSPIKAGGKSPKGSPGRGSMRRRAAKNENKQDVDLHQLFRDKPGVKITGVTSAEYEDITHGPSCTATGPGVEHAYTCEEQAFTIIARDRFGNPRKHGGERFDFRVRGPSSFPCFVRDHGNGSYDVRYTCDVSGEYSLSVMFRGKHVLGSPFSLLIAVPRTLVSNCFCVGDYMKRAVAGDLTVCTIQAVDLFGNKRAIGGDKFAAEIVGPKSIILNTTLKDNDNGTYDIVFTPTRTGEYHCAVSLLDEHVSNSPWVMNVVPGRMHAPHSSMKGPGLMGTVAGKPTFFRVTTKDKCENVCTEGGGQFVFDTSGPAKLNFRVRDYNDGTYQISYVATVAGDYVIEISEDGHPMAGTPFRIKVEPSEPHGPSCVCEGLTDTFAGLLTKFAIESRDVYGNIAPQGGIGFHVKLTGPQAIEGAVEDHEDGTYTASFACTKIGQYTVYVRTDDGKHIGGSPFNLFVEPGPAHALYSTVHGAGATKGVAGEQASFALETRDQYSNKRAVGGDQVNLRFTGPELDSLEGEVIDRDDGTYIIQYTACVAGTYTINVLLNGEPLVLSPLTVDIVPNETHPAACKAAVSDGTLVAGDTGSFKITACDRYGNQRRVGGDRDRIAVDIVYNEPRDESADDGEAQWTTVEDEDASEGEGGATEGATEDEEEGSQRTKVSPFRGIVQDHKNGSYTATWTPRVAGTYTIAASVDDIGIRGVPRKAVVVPGPPFPALCRAEGDGLETAKAGCYAKFVVTTFDMFGNPSIEGGEVVKVMLKGPIEVSGYSADQGDGTYACEYMLKTAGRYDLEVTLNGVQISGSPFEVVVEPDHTHVLGTLVKGSGLDGGKAGDLHRFLIKARDRHLNNRTCGGDDFSVEVTGPQNLKGNVHDNGDGTYTAEFTTPVAGNYNVAVLLGGNTVPGSPFLCTVQSSAATAENCAVANMPREIVAGTENHFFIQAKDSYGNAITKGGDSFDVLLLYKGADAANGGVDKMIPVDVQDLENGSYEANLCATQAGDYLVQVLLGGNKELADSPYDLTVVPAATYTPNCSIVGEFVKRGKVGDEYTFVVQTKDEFGNVRPVGGDVLHAALEGPVKLRADVCDNDDGTYTVTYGTKVCGEYKFSVTLRDDDIARTPFLFRAEARPPHTPYCFATGDALAHAVAGVATEFMITEVDVFGNDTTKGGTLYDVLLRGPCETQGTVVDNKDGTYRAMYTCTQSGWYTLHVSSKDVSIQESPFQVLVAPARTSASGSYAVGKGLDHCIAGKETHFTVIACDQYGNRRATGKDDFQVSFKADDGGEVVDAHTVVTDNTDGSYQIKYKLSQRGAFSMTVTLGTTPISNSPHRVMVAAGDTVPHMCTASGPGMSRVAAGVVSSFTVQAVDEFGSKRRDGGDIFHAQLQGPTRVHADVEDMGNGTYTVSYLPVVAGEYDLDVTMRGIHTKDSPWRVQVDPGIADAQISQVRLNESEIVAGAAAHFTVETKDTFGNALSAGGTPMTAMVSNEHGSLSPVIVDNNDGTFTGEFTPDIAGEYALVVLCDNVQLVCTPLPVRVVPGAVHAPNCLVSGGGLERATAGEEASFTIRARDACLNTCAHGGAEFVVTIKGVEGERIEPVVVQDCNDGSYLVRYTPTRTGTFTISAALGEHVLPGAPFKMVVQPGPTHVPSCEATGSGTSGATCNVTAHFSIQVCDRFGNKRSVGGDRFDVACRGVAKTKFVSRVVDNEDGTYRISYKVTEGGTFLLSVVNQNHVHVAGSPFHIVVEAGESSTNDSIIVDDTSIGVDGIAGGNHALKVQARDKFGNNRVHGGDTFAVHLHREGAPAEEAPVVGGVNDHGNGTYTVSFGAHVAGVYHVHVVDAITEVHVSGSPFEYRVQPDATNAACCWVDGEGLSGGVAGAECIFSLHARDQFKNTRTSGGDVFRASLVGPVSEEGRVIDRSDGSYAVVYSATHCGYYTLTVTLNDRIIPGTPARVYIAPSATHAHSCTASGAGLVQVVAGDTGTFTIEARDCHGNARGTGDDAFAITFVDSHGRELERSETQVVIDDKENGEYAAQYVLKTIGEFVVRVAMDGQPIASSPFSLSVRADATHPPHCEVRCDKRDALSAGQACVLDILAIDRHGNARTSGGDVVHVDIAGPAKVGVDVLDHDNGSYSAYFTPPVAGQYHVSVVVNRQEAKDCPFSLTVHAHDTHAPACSATGVKDLLCGDEGRVVVHARDRVGAPTGRGGDVFTVRLQGAQCDLWADVEDHEDGSYSAAYSSMVSGRYNLIVALDGQHVAGSPFILFVKPRAVHVDSCCARGDGLYQGVVRLPNHFVVQLRDRFGNHIIENKREQLEVSIRGPAQPDVAITPNEDGHFLVNWTTQSAGMYSVFVQVDGNHVNGSPFPCTIATTLAELAQRRRAGEGDGERAGGLDMPVFIEPHKYEQLKQQYATLERERQEERDAAQAETKRLQKEILRLEAEVARRLNEKRLLDEKEKKRRGEM